MPALSPLSTAPKLSATDRVFEALAKAIISFELPPGSKVSEADVSTRLGVSRQPVRDAFFRLSQQGFLSIKPQRSTRITKISEHAVMEAVFVRIAIEVACAKVATTRITDVELDELKAILNAQKSAVDANDSAEFHALDEKFHRSICDFSGHSHAWNLVQEKKAHMDRVRFLSLPNNSQPAYDEHMHFMEALTNRDVNAVETRMTEHIQRISGLISRMRELHSNHFADD